MPKIHYTCFPVDGEVANEGQSEANVIDNIKLPDPLFHAKFAAVSLKLSYG